MAKTIKPHIQKEGLMPFEEEFLKDYDAKYPKFEWFIKKHITKEGQAKLKEARDKNQPQEIRMILNDIWFVLPDHIFNIKENPKGWKEFLSLIEN